MAKKAVFLLVALFFLLGACIPLRPSPPVSPTTFLSPTPSPTSSATPSPTPVVTPTPSLPAPTTPPPPLALSPVSQVVEKVMPAVVSIFTQSVELDTFFNPIPSEAAGTGVVIRPDGYILTNYHVIEGAQEITVNLPESPFFPNGASFTAQVVGQDPLSDLALIKVEANDLPTAQFGDSDQLKVGDWVIAIGNAQALPGGPTVTLGIVSAQGRSIFLPERGITLHDLIQTDAAINPGNSGGPLVNLAGGVVGINTAMESGAQGIGFAIASATVAPIAEQLLAYGKVSWAWLGVYIANLSPAMARELGISVTQGVLIQRVIGDSPAEKAGLEAGDVIIQMAGVDTPTVEKLQKVLRQHRPGDKVELTFVRGEQALQAEATLGEMPQRI